MTVNEKLQELMDWRGFSKKKLGELTGIPASTISGYANGHSDISVETAKVLATGLGVSLWTLLNGTPLLATKTDLSTDEAQMLTDIRGLTLAQRKLVDVMVDTMGQQNKK